jgi:hypothetical protein
MDWDIGRSEDGSQRWRAPYVPYGTVPYTDRLDYTWITLARSMIKCLFRTESDISSLAERLFVDRVYDIFETLDDKSQIWRACVHGTQNVAGELEKIGKRTANECFAINIATKEVIARVNVKSGNTKSADA